METSTRIHLFCKLFFLSYFVWSPLQWPCFRVPHLHILELMFGILAPRSSLRQDTSNSAQQGLGSGSKCQRSSFQVTWSRCEGEKELLERWSLKHTACRTPRAGWIYPVTEWLCESSNGLSQKAQNCNVKLVYYNLSRSIFIIKTCSSSGRQEGSFNFIWSVQHQLIYRKSSLYFTLFSRQSC